MPQITVSNTNPLPAAGQWVSAWQQTDPAFPFVMLTANSDVAGSLAVFEADQNDLQGQPVTAHQIAGLTVGASAVALALGVTGAMLQFQVHAAFYRVVYTNGPVAQAAFAINFWSSTIPVDSSQARKLDLILRELRVQTHLLLALKEPSGLPANLPAGYDLTQGDITPAGLQPSPAPTSTIPAFS